MGQYAQGPERSSGKNHTKGPANTTIKGYLAMAVSTGGKEQITPERSSADGALQVAVGGSDHPDVGADSTSAADTLKLVLL